MSLQSINSYTYSSGFTQGQYHNAVLCISGNVHSIYLDGVLVSSTTTPSNILSNYSTINNILVGCAGDKSCGFTGYLDDFRIYNYGFNATQVANLYSNRNIVAYYKFDNSLNGAIPNYTTLNYDGRLVGNANITSTSGNYLVGTGSLSLTNTSTASYLTSNNSFVTSVANGLSISLWFKTSGVSGSRMRLFDLCTALGTQGISVDISGTNGIVAGYNGYVPPIILYTPTGMKLWLDANVTSSLTKSSNAVTQWNDLALNTNVSGTATYSATGCNGKPTIQFNGSSNKLDSTSMSLYNSLTNFYYFAVLSIPNNNAIYSPFSLISSNRLAIYLNTAGLDQGLAGSAFTYNGTFRFNSVATPTNTFIIVCLEVTGSTQTQTFYINGVAGSSVACDFTASTPNIIEIGNSGYGGDWFNGNMSEILVYTNSISTTERQKIEGYLAWKWGLQTSLPTTHTYYTSAPTI